MKTPNDRMMEAAAQQISVPGDEVARLEAENAELLAMLERLAGQVGPVGAADHAYPAWVSAVRLIQRLKGGAA